MSSPLPVTTLEDYPDWLGAPVTSNPPKQTLTQIRRDIDELTYVAMFDKVLAGIAAGEAFAHICRDDPREPDPGKYMRWIVASPARKSRYYEARETATELLSDHLMSIAEGKDNPLEDVTRSTLRVNTLKWLLSRHNVRRYGDTKTLDINTTVFTPEKLKLLSTDQIKLMLLKGEYDDVTDVTDKLSLEQPDE